MRLPSLGELKAGEAADGDAHAFAPGLFLRGEILLGPFEQLLRRQQFARLAAGDVEFEEAELGDARLGTQKENRLAIGRRHGLERPAEHEAARLGVIAQIACVDGRFGVGLHECGGKRHQKAGSEHGVHGRFFLKFVIREWRMLRFFYCTKTGKPADGKWTSRQIVNLEPRKGGRRDVG